MPPAGRIDELKKRYDENPRRFFAPLANEYRKSGDLEQAIALCQQHLAEQPGNMNGHVVYGQALYEAGRHDEAMATFETALALDPENLIALRHLGEIARSRGEFEKARGWYTRVLDADPRNDEIIAFISEIDAAFLAAPTDSGAAATAPAAAQPPATAVSEPLATAKTLQVEAQRASTSVAAAAAPKLETLASVKTVEIESVPTPVVAQPPVAQPAPRVSAPRMSMGLMDLNIDLDAQAAEPLVTPPASAAAPSPSLAEPAREPIAEPVAEPVAEPPTVPAAELTTDLDSFGDISFDDAPASAALSQDARTAPEVEASLEFDDLDFSMPSASAAPPEILSAAQPEEAPAAEAPQAFVTETMAELYLQQGFTDQALAVYRQLAAADPDNGHFASRVRDLASGVAPGTASVPARPRTARDLFASLAARRALKRDGTPPRGIPAPALADLGTAAAAVPRVSSGGTLDSLFGNVAIDDGDEHVAMAFARVAEAVEPAAAVAGRPTQPAPDELSLDHVFRDSTPARASKVVPRKSEKLRFDQFFTPVGGAPSQEQEAAPPAAAGEPGSPAELEQFQDWLQQLKKT